jgi:hypothetical protein
MSLWYKPSWYFAKRLAWTQGKVDIAGMNRRAFFATSAAVAASAALPAIAPPVKDFRLTFWGRDGKEYRMRKTVYNGQPDISNELLGVWPQRGAKVCCLWIRGKWEITAAECPA